jgi:photosystem II stability/assembly factor-like uncharacterized protein
MASSPDGITWTAKTPPNSELPPYAVAFSPTLSRWLICGSSSVAWISDDNGASWPPRSFSPGYQATEIIWAANKFMIIGSGACYSPNGDSFTPVSTGATPLSLAYDGAQFIVGGNNGVLSRSADGVTWTGLSAGVGTAAITGVARAGTASTTPYVIAASASGLRSGLDISTTQFPAPTIAGAASGFSAYIKAV